MGEDNHPLLWKAPSLINAFKKAYSHNIKNMKEAQESYVHYKNLERIAISNQALAIQVMCDLVIDDCTSYTLRSCDVREHKCQGKKITVR